MEVPPIHPGPSSDELLSLQGDHRSAHIWEVELLTQTLRVRRVNGIWDFLHDRVLHDRVVTRLWETGFYRILEIGRLHLDWSLDVEVLYGLPVDGQPVALPPGMREMTRVRYLDMLQRLTAFRPEDENVLAGTSRFPLTTIRQWLEALHPDIDDDIPDYHVDSWLYRIDQYFAVDNTAANQKVHIVSMNLDDDALAWHRSYLKCRDSHILPPWDEYIEALTETFSEEYTDLMLELKQLKLLAQCDLTVSQAISCFLGGLKEELVNPIKMHEPQTLSKTYRLARLAEATLAANDRALRSSTTSVSSNHLKKPSYEPPIIKHNPSSITSTPRLALPPSTTVSAPRNRRTISLAEMQARRAQGLCYFCDDKYTDGHKYNLPKQLFVMDLEVSKGECGEAVKQESDGGPSTEEWSTVEGDTPMISLCALSGLQGAQTIHVTGYSEKRPIQILLDGGSTHNFIDEKAAKRLGCQICPTRGTTFSSDLIVFPVGKYDLVLGALWMKTLGPITMDYSKLTMAFNYQGKSHLLRGVFEECKVSSPKSLNRLKGEDMQFFMLQVRDSIPSSHTVMHCQALHMTKSDSTSLIDQPYKYSSIKKDIIEKLVNEMLQQGVIQYSSSPFSSPVVLVRKKDGSGYHQIRMLPEDVPKTTFKTHSGHYEYLVMPFGLTNAPSTFQCLMNHLFQKFLRKFVLVFFDDILIYNVNLQDHVGHLKQGILLLLEGFLLILGKLKQSSNAVKQLRGFLVLAGYYRKFIRGYGLISRPLTDFLKKDGFLWNAKVVDAFAALKLTLTSAPVLVETDASGTGIGVVFMQNDHPIAFISKGLAPRHMALSVYEKELLALVFTITKWSHYLLGHHFIVRTDQKALKYLLEQKLHTDLQKHFTWINNQLRRKGKLMVGNDLDLMTAFVTVAFLSIWWSLWH
ncbi:PREDICTED: uncharacterized protein LOC109227846 [Nicotiana attenuata]|uniref:uncharacterized protein LOC109227846 n=1 Tax=Nicotiana attenuata TaxID=49451 RepID=UPI0009056C11|nr:PREDICTED: uncharacterized protein LOC109227846 [Nicotiana attenuata]